MNIPTKAFPRRGRIHVSVYMRFDFFYGEGCARKRVRKAFVVFKTHRVDEIVVQPFTVAKRGDVAVHSALAHFGSPPKIENNDWTICSRAEQVPSPAIIR